MTDKEPTVKDPELVQKLSQLYSCLLGMVDNETHMIGRSSAGERRFHKGRRDGAEDALMHFYRLGLDKHLPPWD